MDGLVVWQGPGPRRAGPELGKGEVAGRGRAGQPRRLPVPVLSDSDRDGVTGCAKRASGRVSRGTGLSVTVVTVFMSIFLFKF